jgi:hypothetical protein
LAGLFSPEDAVRGRGMEGTFVRQWNVDDDMDRCRAAVPRMAHNLTGRMVGGDPAIETVQAVPSWSECGDPAAAVHVYRCGDGRVPGLLGSGARGPDGHQR